jgi:hypothetical protein
MIVIEITAIIDNARDFLVIPMPLDWATPSQRKSAAPAQQPAKVIYF